MVLLAAGWAASQTALVALLEARSIDLRFRARGELAPDPEIVLIGVDEASFARLGVKYPFPPLVWAKLIERLNGAGAAVIAFDFLYSEPTRECDPPDQDARLAEVAQRAGNIVWAEQLRDGRVPEPPIPAIRDAVAATGFINLPDERDGRIRRVAPARSGRRCFAAAAVEAYAGYLPREWQEEALRLIPYRGGAGTFPTVSLGDVLAGEVPAELIAGRICFVGATFAASHDTYPTPFHRVDLPDSPGVEIHATVAAAILRGDRLVETSPKTAWLILGLAVLAIAWLVGADRPWWALGLQACALAVWGAWTVERFLAGEVVPAIVPMGVLAASFPSVAFVSYLLERSRRREILGLFESYVDPSVVAWLLDNPTAVNLTGGRHTVTILESDIEGFTPITEQLPPEVLVGHLNAYFEILTGAVIDAGGMHDKYVGDALLAVFGFPVAQPDHAERGVTAALAIQEHVEHANAEWERQGMPVLHTRVGLASGEVVIGTVGARARKTFTAIGEAVNLAARLEALNKPLGTRILLDEATAERLPAELPVRDLGEHAIKGFSRPVRVFTPDAAPVTDGGPSRGGADPA